MSKREKCSMQIEACMYLVEERGGLGGEHGGAV